MTDIQQAREWVDAEKLRELLHWREVIEQTPIKSTEAHLIALLHALLPPPPLQTLADMSLEELKAYIGGEVMVDGWANPTMLVSVIEDEGAVLARRLNKPWPFVEVRPLSDLTPVAAPEQEWPGDDDDHESEYCPVCGATLLDDGPECEHCRKHAALPRPQDINLLGGHR